MKERLKKISLDELAIKECNKTAYGRALKGMDEDGDGSDVSIALGIGGGMIYGLLSCLHLIWYGFLPIVTISAFIAGFATILFFAEKGRKEKVEKNLADEFLRFEYCLLKSINEFNREVEAFNILSNFIESGYGYIGEGYKKEQFELQRVRLEKAHRLLTIKMYKHLWKEKTKDNIDFRLDNHLDQLASAENELAAKEIEAKYPPPPPDLSEDEWKMALAEVEKDPLEERLIKLLGDERENRPDELPKPPDAPEVNRIKEWQIKIK